ncbi:hypothetical protein, partial [Escherichia coli]|uniref:hypothetical protein n=1 Tax=Escherichia coli TaxID=562 RepID=UPI001953F659
SWTRRKAPDQYITAAGDEAYFFLNIIANALIISKNGLIINGQFWKSGSLCQPDALEPNRWYACSATGR